MQDFLINECGSLKRTYKELKQFFTFKGKVPILCLKRTYKELKRNTAKAI